MPAYAAFLRAINVGGRYVTMDRLRAVFEGLGLADVRTVITSGNVLVASPRRAAGALERSCEVALREALGYEVRTFIRQAAEVHEIVRRCPFTPGSDGSIYVVFLPAPPAPGVQQTLGELSDGDNAYRVVGREIYWFHRTGGAPPRITAPRFDRLTGPATNRNLNTVRRIATLLGER